MQNFEKTHNKIVEFVENYKKGELIENQSDYTLMCNYVYNINMPPRAITLHEKFQQQIIDAVVNDKENHGRLTKEKIFNKVISNTTLKYESGEHYCVGDLQLYAMARMKNDVNTISLISLTINEIFDYEVDVTIPEFLQAGYFPCVKRKIL